MGAVSEQVIGEAPCSVLVVPRDAGMTINKVLVATDGSDRCERAVAEAVSYAKRNGAALYAISVARKESDLEDARKNLQHVEDVAAKEGVSVESITDVGTPYQKIADTAKEKGADLIVVGRKGKTGIKSFFMGSNSERVIGLSSCAILVVH